MNKVSNNHTCIRINADENQIQACKVQLQSIDSKIEKVARILNLAGNGTRLKIFNRVPLPAKFKILATFSILLSIDCNWTLQAWIWFSSAFILIQVWLLLTLFIYHYFSIKYRSI